MTKKPIDTTDMVRCPRCARKKYNGQHGCYLCDRIRCVPPELATAYLMLDEPISARDIDKLRKSLHGE